MRCLPGGALAVLLCCAVACAAPARAGAWSVAWSAAPDSAGPALQAQTIRQVVRASVGGAGVRVRLSNLFGAGPLAIGPVHVARRGAGSAIVAGTDHVLTFDGASSVMLAKGANALSDPVAMEVAPLQELAVSLYVPGDTGPSTIHGTAVQTAYLVPVKDVTASVTLPAAVTDDSRYFLTDVEVLRGDGARAVVVVGDSISDGIGSTLDRNARWPDVLAERLQGDPALAGIAVVNSGISGNRILNDGVDPFVGPSALARFGRDALSKPGVRWVLLFEGINDINANTMLAAPEQRTTAQQIIAGMRELVARAHARGVKVWGATLMPCTGAGAPFKHTPQNEALRLTVNTWIREGGAFDALVDFDRLMRDPAHPERLRPEYDSGDHLHPNDAGHKAMAAAIDVRWFGAGQ